MPSVTVYNITRGDHSHLFTKGVYQLGQAGTPLGIEVGGPYLDDNRNKCVVSFLNDTTADWLLFVDSDIGFAPSDINELLDFAETVAPDVVGGLYVNPEPGRMIPVAYRLGEHQIYPGCPALNPIDMAEALADTSPIAVDAVGTGFMAIHRDLLTEMDFGAPTRWFAEATFAHPDAPPGSNAGTHMGEDMTFCLRVREMGYHVHLHRGVRLHHSKTIILHPDDYKD